MSRITSFMRVYARGRPLLETGKMRAEKAGRR